MDVKLHRCKEALGFKDLKINYTKKEIYCAEECDLGEN